MQQPQGIVASESATSMKALKMPQGVGQASCWSFTKQAHTAQRHVLFFFFFSKGMWQCLTRTMFTNGTGLFENVGVHGRNFLACKRTKAENGQRPNIHPAQRAVGHSIGMQDTSPNKILRLLMQQHTTCLFQEHCQPIDEAAREKYKHQTFR